jgi:hypothetical protein
MGHHNPEEVMMTKWPIAQPDLFRSVPSQTELAPTLRRRAVTLLQMLLMEASDDGSGPRNAPGMSEVSDDKDHA